MSPLGFDSCRMHNVCQSRRFWNCFTMPPQRLNVQRHGLFSQGPDLLDRIAARNACWQIGNIGGEAAIVGLFDDYDIIHLPTSLQAGLLNDTIQCARGFVAALFSTTRNCHRHRFGRMAELQMTSSCMVYVPAVNLKQLGQFTIFHFIRNSSQKSKRKNQLFRFKLLQTKPTPAIPYHSAWSFRAAPALRSVPLRSF